MPTRKMAGKPGEGADGKDRRSAAADTPVAATGQVWLHALRRAVWIALPLMLVAMVGAGWWGGRHGEKLALRQVMEQARMAAGMVDGEMLGHSTEAPPGDLRQEYFHRLLRRLSQNLAGQPPVRLWVLAGQGVMEYRQGKLAEGGTPELQAAVRGVVQAGQTAVWEWPDSANGGVRASVLAPVLLPEGGEAPAVLEVGVQAIYLEDYRRRHQILGGVAGLMGGVLSGILLLGVFYRRKVTHDVCRLNAVLAEELEGHQRADASVRKLSRALENCPIAVIITDARGCIEYVNPKFEELTGYSAAEAVGQNPRLLKSGVMPPEVYQDLWQSLVARGYWVGEMLNRRKNGTLYWEMAHISCLKDAQGRVTNYVGAMEDITARKQAQEELQAAKIAAEEAARAKSEFLANMSHEIRTPMNGVIGLTSLLEHTTLTPEQRELVGSIRASGEALLLLLNDILDYSKIEAGRLELHPEDFNLAECLREVLQALSPRAAQKELNLAGVVDAEVPAQVRGDMLRLRQILFNLVGNAIKFTSHGEVVVRVSLGEGQTPLAKDQPGEVGLHFAVRDTGPGIPPEHMARLFEKFSQGDASVTRRHGGTGLGLAICKRLTEMMGGRIWVESQVNEGSTFHFTVRFGRAATQAPKETGPRLEGCSMLLFSASYTHRVMLERAAQMLGLSLQKAATVDRLWQVLQSGPAPGLVLIEPWASPEMLRELVRELSTTLPTTRLAVMTYRETDIKQIQPLGLPLAGMLYKPLLSTDLPRQVAALWEGQLRAAPASPTATLDAHLSQRVPLKILLVDDNAINLKVGAGTLEKLGYVPDVAADGLEALEAMGRCAYDLVFLDVQMPRMDGLEVARRVRRDLPPERQPILVALTAGAMQGDRERCLAAGMNDYLSKPFRAQQLQQVIEKWHSALLKKGSSAAEPLAVEPSPVVTRPDAPPSVATPPAAAMAPAAAAVGAPAAAGEEPVDFTRLAEVNNAEPEAMAEMAQLFEEQADELLAGVKEAMERQDAARVKVHAHKLRGSCGACGMVAMLEPLAALEREAVAGRWDAVAAHWQATQAAYDSVKTCLRQRLPYNPVPA